MRVVLDTNILVSASAYRGNEWRLLSLAQESRYELYTSPHVLEELQRVLAGPNFGWDAERITRTALGIVSVSTLIDPPRLTESLTGHPPDDRILDCVAAAEADFLVTGDRRHLLPLRTFGNARIVTAAEFLEELESQDS